MLGIILFLIINHHFLMAILIFFIFSDLNVIHLTSDFIQGSYQRAEIVDSVLYICSKRGLEIYNIADPQNPQILSYIATDGKAIGLDVVSNYVYLADDYAGLVIFNVSDLANPFYVGGYRTSGFVQDVMVKDTFAYVADMRQGLIILNVANANYPSFVGSWQQDNYYPLTIFVADSFAYLGAFMYVPSKIINISNPQLPYWVADFPQTGSGGLIWDAFIVDTLAYLVGSWSMPGIGIRHFFIVNVANPTSPIFISGLFFDQPCSGIVVQGHCAYINNQGLGVRIVDISDPFHPVQTALIKDAISYGYESAIKDSILVTPEFEEGFTIFDVSDPYNPVRLYRSPSMFWYGFSYTDSLHQLYLMGAVRQGAGRHTSFMFVDANDVFNFQVKSEMNFLGECQGHQLISSYPYLLFQIEHNVHYLGVIDITDICTPQLFKFTESPSSMGPSQSCSSSVYCGAGYRSMFFIGDIFSEPLWVDSLATPAECFSVQVHDSFAFAACMNKLATYNLNRDSLINCYNHNHFYAGYCGFVINFPLLYINYTDLVSGQFRDGYLIFDVSSPANPILLTDTMMPQPTGPYENFTYLRGCALDDTLFYLCRGPAGFDIWNVADPVHPKFVFRQDTPGFCKYIHVINDTIFVMDMMGIEVYALENLNVQETIGSDEKLTSFISVKPNPFTKQTSIQYNLRSTGNSDVCLKIYNSVGQLVRHFDNLVSKASHQVIWKGEDDTNRELPQGVYILHLSCGGQYYTTKVILLK